MTDVTHSSHSQRIFYEEKWTLISGVSTVTVETPMGSRKVACVLEGTSVSLAYGGRKTASQGSAKAQRAEGSGGPRHPGKPPVVDPGVALGLKKYMFG